MKSTPIRHTEPTRGEGGNHSDAQLTPRNFRGWVQILGRWVFVVNVTRGVHGQKWLGRSNWENAELMEFPTLCSDTWLVNFLLDVKAP